MKVEEILTINYYADKDSGDKMWLPIIETKYRFVLPSEEYWHE